MANELGNEEILPQKQQAPIKAEAQPQKDRDLLKTAWERSMGKPYEKLTHEERQSVDAALERGMAPVGGGAIIPPEEILRFVDSGEGTGFSREDLDGTLRAQGFSDEDINNRSEEEKIDMLRSKIGDVERESEEENENEQMRARIFPILEKLYESGDLRMGDIIDNIPPEDREQIEILLSEVEGFASGSVDLQNLDTKIAQYRRDNAEFARIDDWASTLVQVGEGEISLINTPDGPRVFVPRDLYEKWRTRVELQQLRQTYNGLLRGENLGYPARSFANHIRNILDYTYPAEDASRVEAGVGGEDLSGRPAEAAGAGGGGRGERPPRRPTAAGGGEPPEEPPTATGGAGEEEPRGRINIDKEGITDEKILQDIRGAEAGYAQSTTLDERLAALRDAYQKIIHEDVPNEQKDLGLGALQEHIDRLVARKQAREGEIAAERALSQSEREEARNKARQMREVLQDPNLSYEDKLQQLENTINGLDPNERTYPHVVAMAIEGIETRELDYVIEDLLEYSLERFLNRADAQPLEDYPQFTFTESENLAIITHTARRFDEVRKNTGIELGINPGRREMFTYLTTLSNRRRVMHEIFKSLNDLESYTGLVTRALRKSGMSFVEKQLVGVTDVQIIYDKVLLALKSMKPQQQGWLLEEDFEVGDRMVRELLEDSMRNHSAEFNKSYIVNDGTTDGVGDTRPLRQWEIDRAFHMGRDLSGASQRRVIYGILGDVPENTDEFLKSVAHEPIARRLAPLKLIPDRFFGQAIAKRFIGMFKEEQRRNARGVIDYNKYGYIAANGQERGMFGSSQGDFAILDLGIVDPKSNSWRARLLYLKNPRFQTETFNGRPTTLGAFLDNTKLEHTRGIEHHERPDAIEAWNNEIAGRILEQRLFLGVLMRYGDLDRGNKIVIWNNVADLLPSRIASLLPNETLGLMGMREPGQMVDGHEVTAVEARESREQAIQQWMGIASKLWLAERMRVGDDVRVASGGGGEYHPLDFYFERAGITDPGEIALITRIQELGRDSAPTLANVKFPFTAFLDDAPETDWERLSDFDFTRILVNDQNSFQEGYGHIMGLLDNPIKKIEDVNKILIEAFEKIKGPPGVGDAQKIFEPIIRATYKMRRMTQFAKWFGESLTRVSRMPTSITEEYNLSAGVGDDEKEMASGLKGLAQAEVINDDPNELDDFGRTQLFRLRHDLDADRSDVLIGFLRLLIQIGGEAFAEEFAKSLGIKL